MHQPGCGTSSLRLELIPAAADQEPVLANLFELYAYDFSVFQALEMGPDGRFGYSHLSLYWREPDRHPFLVKADGRLAGFVLVKKGAAISTEGNVWDVAEFFVLRGYRRHGIGTHIAHQVWRHFPGRWEIRVMEANASARLFWERAVAEFTGETPRLARIERDGKWWHVLAFESPPEP